MKKDFPETPVPSRQSIYNLKIRFELAGSVKDSARSGRRNTALFYNKDLILCVKNAVKSIEVDWK